MSEGEAWTPLILAVAPNGARRTKADHPALPMTAEELAREAETCVAAGAAMIHLHVRDDEGGHSLDPGRYREAIAEVRARLGDDIVIQITTEAVGRYRPDEQMAAVRAVGPEAVSLAVREFFAEDGDGAAVTTFLEDLAEAGTLAQFILYSDEDLRWFEALVEKGAIPAALAGNVLFVLGRYSAGQRSDPQDLLAFLAANEARRSWMVCAFGARENACALTAAALSGHVRVGFENNLMLADGSQASDNAALVSQAARGAEAIGRPLADAKTARAVMAGGAIRA